MTPDGFESIYRENIGHVLRFASWLCRDAAEAEDLAAETFLRAWRRREAIRTETLRAYLLRITRNLYLERRRRRDAEPRFEPPVADPSPDAERALGARRELGAVARQLASLPEIDQSAFRLRLVHELPYEEIGRVLGISAIAARVKVHRARARLVVGHLDQGATP